MGSQFLLGLLSPAVVTALALQQIDQTKRICEDCHLQPGANHTEIASTSIVCECCWRDCDYQLEHVQVTAAASVLHTGVVDADDAQDSPHTEIWKKGFPVTAIFSYTDRRLRPVLVEEGAVDTWDTTLLSDVDAWLIVHLRKEDDLDCNFWTPILETVKTAVESYGSNVRIVRFRDIGKILAAVKEAVAQGRRPLVFTVAHEFSTSWGRTFTKMHEVKEAGAYVVAYQAEPAGNVTDELGRFRLQTRTLNISAVMNADEVWDYSFSNIDNYRRQGNKPVIRYVPPGYVSRLDVGVDINSPRASASRIGYMGSTCWKTESETYAHLLGKRLYVTNNVWSNADVRRYLETYPLQLNQHRWQKEWKPQFQHVEAFRMATLLANKACVISPPSNSKDMSMWQDVITFAEIKNTVRVMDQLARRLTDCRTQSYETFKRKFDAQKLLQDSGFFEAWRPPHGI